MSCAGWRIAAIVEGLLLLAIVVAAAYVGALVLRTIYGGRGGP